MSERGKKTVVKNETLSTPKTSLAQHRGGDVLNESVLRRLITVGLRQDSSLALFDYSILVASEIGDQCRAC